MLLEELSDGLSFVRGEIVEDDVNPKGLGFARWTQVPTSGRYYEGLLWPPTNFVPTWL